MRSALKKIKNSNKYFQNANAIFIARKKPWLGDV